jgi:hypothetical protein
MIGHRREGLGCTAAALPQPRTDDNGAIDESFRRAGGAVRAAIGIHAAMWRLSVESPIEPMAVMLKIGTLARAAKDLG